MSGKLGVVWLWHAHQPVGEREAVLDAACEERYAPAIAALAAAPNVRVGWHISGPLAEWLSARHPAIVAALRDLVADGRVELIGGGLGAPRLREVPPRDRVGQIRALRAHLERTYETRVTGVWSGIFERATAMAPTLLDADVEWMPAYASDSSTPATTPVALLEASGRSLRVFEYHLGASAHSALRDGPEGMLSELRQAMDGGVRGAAVQVDVESWAPGVAERWVSTVAATEWIESIVPRDALDRWRAERVTQAVPWGSDRADAFRAMLDARIRVASARCAMLTPAHRGAEAARRHLYRSQGHLDDGARGAGRPRLRAALVASAMRAEKLAHDALGEEIPGLEVREADLTADGHDEILVQTPSLATIVVPRRGGHLAVLDDTRAGFDWLVPLRWDAERWPREAAVDRILPADATVDVLAGGEPADESDLASGVYIARVAQSPDQVRVVLARAGTWRRGYAGRPVRIEKELRCEAGANALEIRYTITGGGSGTDDALFVSEWNIGMLEPDSDDRWLRGPDGERWGSAGARCDHDGVLGLDCVDETRGTILAIRTDRAVRVATWPVSAFGRYQATAIALCVPISLGGDATQEFTISASFGAP